MSGTVAHHRDRIGDPGLARALEKAVAGDVRFDALTRGLYATDASIYQMEPLGVVFPKTIEDVSAVFAIARAEGVPVLPRGAGTSQCGQTVGHAIVLDTSKSLNRILMVDAESKTASVQPGLVLDHLNRSLPENLFFPVDVATANRATLGGMAGNNSGGARSIKYGIMADNVTSIEAELSDGRVLTFDSNRGLTEDPALGRLIESILHREADELQRRVPTVLRHVAGYGLHRLLSPDASMAELLVGSEGTLGFFRSLTLKLQPRPERRVLGVCLFPDLLSAMDAVQHLAALEPDAIELLDQNLLGLARANRSFRATVDRFVPPGTGDSVLLVEFAGEAGPELGAKLDSLTEAVRDLKSAASVIRAEEPRSQDQIWALRRASLSIAMSVKGDRKPVSFVEDCAVPLDRLREYAYRMQEIFAQHGTEAIWYAHASVGCLHVRPSLSMKSPADVARMREIATEVHELVRSLNGSHSGEHGDGLLRSEFIEPMLGPRIANAFAELKQAFDPSAIMNPGKIVGPTQMDDRALFRYGPDYRTDALPTAMDWSSWGGLPAAVEMCNNNGACRKFDPGVMCPSYRVTLEEVDTTRGRANILRRALSGQLGAEGLHSPQVRAALDLCVGCKACKTECPTGVDMARMKAEVLYQRSAKNRLRLRDRSFAHLPRLARLASRAPWLMNLRNRVELVARLTDRTMGIAARRTLPTWSANPFLDNELESLAEGRGAHDQPARSMPDPRGAAVLFVDTFNRYFEPEIPRAAHRYLARAHEIAALAPTRAGAGRPLCCGRTYISAGLLGHAREELKRTIHALYPMARAGFAIIGLEPSCLLTLRDEAPDLVSGPEARIVATRAVLIDEFLHERRTAGTRTLALPTASAPNGRPTVHVHGHCHQKAFGTERASLDVLDGLAGFDAEPIVTSCCGMAGSFGYESEHVQTSEAMGELSLFPAIRQMPTDEPIVANGFSCRAQIKAGTGRQAVHLVQLLERSTRTSSTPLHPPG